MKPRYTEFRTKKELDVRLYDTFNSPQVFWSQQHNSYVLVADESGWWTAEDGTACDLYSVNGAGEVRWVVSSFNGNTTGDRDAARYFGLTWHGNRSKYGH